jgi:hypothetical protein
MLLCYRSSSPGNRSTLPAHATTIIPSGCRPSLIGQKFGGKKPAPLVVPVWWARGSMRVMRLLVLPLLTYCVASAQNFMELKQLYDYDRAEPLELKLSQTASRNGYTLYDVSYSLPNKQRTDGFLVVPQGRSRKPAVVWLHSSGALAWLGDAILLTQSGAVSLIINPPASVGSGTPEGDRDAMIAAVVALRRAADILEAREDVDRTASRSWATASAP